MADPDLVLCDVDQGVAVLTLNRPDRNNGWTPALGERYFTRLDQAAADPQVRAIVVTGAGKSFCPGADMERLGETAATGSVSRDGLRPMTYPLTIAKPIVCAINGGCAGIGFVQSLMCDVRFAARGARFATAYARRGLVAEYGISSILPRIVGLQRALDLLLTGRTFEADEALSMGLVLGVVERDELLNEAKAYAKELATACSPLSMEVIRRQVYGDLNRDPEDAHERAVGLMQRLLPHSDFREGLASFLEKRDPCFEPLAAPLVWPND